LIKRKPVLTDIYTEHVDLEGNLIFNAIRRF